MAVSFTLLAFILYFFIGIVYAEFSPISYLSAELCAAGAIGSKVITKNDLEYNDARMGERIRKQRYPLVIAYPMNSTQVQSLVLCAVFWKKTPCVRNGGHSNEGYSSIDDSIVIDLKYMNNVEYDPTSGIATVQGGIRLGPLYLELDKYQQTIISANGPTVGLSGSIASGGFGIQSRKYGVAGDFVVEAEVILANGTIVTASDSSNPDLFWALRGGGGGTFGIVTQWKLKTIQAWVEATNFNTDFNIVDFNIALKLFSNWAYNANFSLSTFLYFSNKELRVIGTGICNKDLMHKWLFETELFKIVGAKTHKQTCNHLQSRAYFLDNENIREKLCTQRINLLNIGIDPLGPNDNITISTPTLVTEGIINTIPPGFKQNRELVKTKSFFFNASAFSDANIATLNNLRTTMPDGAYAELTSYGGYLETLPTNLTAFSHRTGTAYHILLNVPLTGSETDVNAKLDYVKLWESTVGPISNDLGDQFGEKYFGNNYKKLKEIKSSYDPTNLFVSSQSIPPNPTTPNIPPSLPNINQCPLGFFGGNDPPGFLPTQNWSYQGTGDLLGCLMFKASCRLDGERNRTSRNETLINFYGDYENNGTISTGDYATNIQHIKRKSSTLEIEEKNRQKKVESYAESTISSTETKTDFDSDYMKTHKKASN
ncbi:889_t:CDS:2 [Entrophospora sp. SA101]|nr:889_t:CDS:2 [Entrophospora sp. SA101]